MPDHVNIWILNHPLSFEHWNILSILSFPFFLILSHSFIFSFILSLYLSLFLAILVSLSLTHSLTHSLARSLIDSPSLLRPSLSLYICTHTHAHIHNAHTHGALVHTSNACYFLACECCGPPNHGMTAGDIAALFIRVFARIIWWQIAISLPQAAYLIIIIVIIIIIIIKCHLIITSRIDSDNIRKITIITGIINSIIIIIITIKITFALSSSWLMEYDRRIFMITIRTDKWSINDTLRSIDLASIRYIRSMSTCEYSRRSINYDRYSVDWSINGSPFNQYMINWSKILPLIYRWMEYDEDTLLYIWETRIIFHISDEIISNH